MKFVIIHGSFGSPEGNWFPELTHKLRSLGQVVITPEFPVENWQEITAAGPKQVPKKQSLKTWLAAFNKIVKTFKPGEPLCFVGHSLGCLFILHAIEKYKLKLDCAIFVSPFLRPLGKDWQFDLVNKIFYKTNFNFVNLKKLIPTSYVLYSDNDPYVDKQNSIGFAKHMRSSVILIKNAGHLNKESGFTNFPLLLELCKTRLIPLQYQKQI